MILKSGNPSSSCNNIREQQQHRHLLPELSIVCLVLKIDARLNAIADSKRQTMWGLAMITALLSKTQHQIPWSSYCNRPYSRTSNYSNIFSALQIIIIILSDQFLLSKVAGCIYSSYLNGVPDIRLTSCQQSSPTHYKRIPVHDVHAYTDYNIHTYPHKCILQYMNIQSKTTCVSSGTW